MAKSKIEKALTFAMVRPDHQVKTMFYLYGFEQAPLEKANFVVFPGGADINPFLYGEKRLPTTYINHIDDLIDIKALKNTSIYQNKIGICRGGQFLNVMVGGGKLYQHVNNHAIHGTHKIECLGVEKKDAVRVTSTHHQMMIPSERGKVLYAANLATEKHTDQGIETYEDEERKYLYDDAEVIVYPDDNTLCFQPHPEYNVDNNGGCTALFFELIADYFLSETESEAMYGHYTKHLSEVAKSQQVSMYGRNG